MKKAGIPFIILTIIVFMGLLFPSVLQEGMFMDGLIYSSVAQNLSENTGTFWNLRFSETILKDFFEHPPLVFGIQSLFFRVFGSVFMIEKIYSFLTALISSGLIILIWNRISVTGVKNSSLSWLPVLFWISTPHVFWCFNNNMLENTMSMFNLSAIYTLILSIQKPQKKETLLIFISGMLICLGALSKGLPAFFPVGFYFLFWISTKKISILKMLKNTTLLVIFILGLFSMLFLFSENAIQGIVNYFDNQVILSLEGGSRIIHRRSHIMEKLLIEISGFAVISCIIILIYYKGNLMLLRRDNFDTKYFFFFLLVGFSASAPLMISPKQSTFYVVPSIPYFAIAFASIISPHISNWLNKINTKSYFYSTLKYLSILALGLVMVYSFSKKETYFRDHELIGDIKTLGKMFPKNTTFSISPAFYNHWGFISYSQRYFFFNYDRSGTLLEYHIQETGEPVPLDYERLRHPELNTFKVFRRIKP